MNSNKSPCVLVITLLNKWRSVALSSTVEELKGDGILETAVFRNLKTGELTEHHADEEDGTFGLFAFVGYIPHSDTFKGHIEMDDWGYIKTDDEMRTNIEGVFAAGDIRPKALRQVVTATADGAIAATLAEKYMEVKF